MELKSLQEDILYQLFSLNRMQFYICFIYTLHLYNLLHFYCILRGQIKGFNSSITAIMCQVGSYRTVVGSDRMVE